MAVNLTEKALGLAALTKACWFRLKMEAEAQQKQDRAVKQSSSWLWWPGAGAVDVAGSDVSRIQRFLNSWVTSEEDM